MRKKRKIPEMGKRSSCTPVATRPARRPSAEWNGSLLFCFPVLKRRALICKSRGAGPINTLPAKEGANASTRSGQALEHQACWAKEKPHVR